MARQSNPEEREILKKRTGARIREARKKSGLTRDAIVAAVGYKLGWLTDIESGRNSIKEHDLAALAALFERPVAWFLDEDPWANASHPPGNRFEWELMYPGDPKLAAAHAALDSAVRRPSSGAPPSPESPPPAPRRS